MSLPSATNTPLPHRRHSLARTGRRPSFGPSAMCSSGSCWSAASRPSGHPKATGDAWQCRGRPRILVAWRVSDTGPGCCWQRVERSSSRRPSGSPRITMADSTYGRVPNHAVSRPVEAAALTTVTARRLRQQRFLWTRRRGPRCLPSHQPHLRARLPHDPDTQQALTSADCARLTWPHRPKLDRHFPRCWRCRPLPVTLRASVPGRDWALVGGARTPAGCDRVDGEWEGVLVG